jgi:hypothetical protein
VLIKKLLAEKKLEAFGIHYLKDSPKTQDAENRSHTVPLNTAIMYCHDPMAS